MTVQQLVAALALILALAATFAPRGGRLDPYRVQVLAAVVALILIAWLIGPGPVLVARG